MLITKRILLTLFFIAFIASNYAQTGFTEQQVDLNVYQSFKKVHNKSELKLALKIDVHENWHINSDQPKDEFLIPTTISVKPEEKVELNLVKFPEAHDFNFAFSDKPVSVFEGTVYIGAIVKIPETLELGEHTLKVALNYQACNDQSCMPPNSIEKEITFEVVDKSTPVQQINNEVFAGLDLSYTAPEPKVEESSLGKKLEESGLFVSLIIVFLGGLALNLTPCVYPLIPITIGYFGGQSEGSTGKLFGLGTFYILGMALTYSIVGVVTSLSGAIFGSLLQNPIVIIVIALIFVALSLSMFGMYEMKMPDKWVMKAGGAKSGVFGAFFMGLTMGIVAAPCIGPFVLGLVTFVAAKGDPFYGFLMFFTMAVGLGLPYLFLALFSGKIKSLPKAGMWMEAVKRIFGFILLGMALYFLQPLIPKVIRGYVLPIFMLGSGIYLLFGDKLANDVKGFRIFKTIFSVVIIVFGVAFLLPEDKKAPDWTMFNKDVYEQALNNNEKIIIDCYADWCIACKELDALTFSDEKVIDLSKDFKMLKVDMTVAGSEISEYAREEFDVKGLPTVIFINSEGQEVKRITGFLEAEKFAEIMNSVN